MKLHFQRTALLLTLAIGLTQTALAQETNRAVFWCVTTSSKAKSLEKAREAHKALLDGLREQQAVLKVDDKDIFIDSPELHRIMYRTRPGGYEFRQSVYLRQRDIARFDDFFEALAPNDSNTTRISFSFRPVTWEPAVVSNPDVVEWRVTVVGGGKTLVESKQRFDERLGKMQALLEEYEIAAIETGNPIMYTVPEQLPKYEKPDEYTFERDLAFRQKDLEKFDLLLDEFSDLDSEYLHVRYTLEKEKK